MGVEYTIIVERRGRRSTRSPEWWMEYARFDLGKVYSLAIALSEAAENRIGPPPWEEIKSSRRPARPAFFSESVQSFDTEHDPRFSSATTLAEAMQAIECVRTAALIDPLEDRDDLADPEVVAFVAWLTAMHAYDWQDSTGAHARAQAERDEKALRSWRDEADPDVLAIRESLQKRADANRAKSASDPRMAKIGRELMAKMANRMDQADELPPDEPLDPPGLLCVWRVLAFADT